jgi:steroid delta-isomerase-like uncharacterized protein
VVRFVSLMVLLAAFAPSNVALPVTAQEATPVAAPAIVSELQAALNAHDADAAAALYAEDAVVTQAVRDGNVFTGREQIRRWIAANLGGVPDLTVTTDTVIAEGDRIAWAWTYSGTYTGRFPGFSPGEGQPITLRVVSLLELRDELIARETLYYDNAAFLALTAAQATSAASGADAGAVTVRVFSCPPAAAGTSDQSALLAACAPEDDPALAPTLRLLPDGAPAPGTVSAAGVYRWEELPVGDYAIGGGAMPAEMTGLLVLDAAGSPVQNPVVRIDADSPEAQLDYFYLLPDGTPLAG